MKTKEITVIVLALITAVLLTNFVALSRLPYQLNQTIKDLEKQGFKKITVHSTNYGYSTKNIGFQAIYKGESTTGEIQFHLFTDPTVIME